MNAANNLYNFFMQRAAANPEHEIKLELKGLNLKVVCVRDIIDRYCWFNDSVPISESYAKILIERANEVSEIQSES